MESNNVNARVRDFIVANFPLARTKPPADDESLFGGGIIDSLGVMDLVGFVEEEFSITVADEDFLPENFETIAQLSAFIHTKHQGHSNGAH